MKISDILISVLVGLPTGILGSLLAWWILFHRIVPDVRFSNTISKTPTNDNGSGYRYRIKFENSGKRSIVDLEIIAKFRIKGLHPSYQKNWEVIYIPLEYGRIPRSQPVKKSKLREIIRLYIDKVEELGTQCYPDQIRNKFNNKTILLEDLFSLGTDRTLQLFVFGYDEFSGTRKVFQSKIYTVNDIKCGPFDSKGLEVVSENETGKVMGSALDMGQS